MATEARPSNYWIASNALYIQLNAMGKPNYIQGNVVSGAYILCYIRGIEGLEYDAGHNYQRWPLSLSSSVFPNGARRYIYVAIPRIRKTDNDGAFVCFPSLKIDLYGKAIDTITVDGVTFQEGEQVGSENYYYIFLQGILSAGETEDGKPQDREWELHIDTGTLSSDESIAAGGEGSWWKYNSVSDTISFIKTILSATFNELNASIATLKKIVIGEKSITGIADDSTKDTDDVSIATPLWVNKYGNLSFLSRLRDDTASGFITFLKGIKATAASYFADLFASGSLSVDGDTRLGDNGTKTTFGKYVADTTGAQIAVDGKGASYAEFDYITIRRAADFREITIRELRYIGGELAITPAAMTCSKVERLDADGNVIDATDTTTTPSAYRCYFETEDGKGKKLYQEFVVGDQAQCKQFGVKGDGTYESMKTRYYWRLVTATGSDYIVLSNKKGEMDEAMGINSEPAEGDNIIQLGYQGEDRPNRQAAQILSASANDAPSTKFYQGIHDFSLKDCIVKDEGVDVATGTFHSNVYGDAYMGDRTGKGGYLQYDADKKRMTFKGVAHFESGSTLDGDNILTEPDLANIGVHSGNLLLNTSFLGEYQSADIDGETEVSEDKVMFSSPIEHWNLTHAEVVSDEDSESGKSVRFAEGGILSQAMPCPIKEGKSYMLSFRGKGTTATVAVGGTSYEIEMASYLRRFSVAVSPAKDDADFSISCDDGSIMEIILTEGNIVSEWSQAFADNDKSLLEMRNYEYLSHAISEGSTTIDGGLVMSEQFRVGKYRDKTLQKETGGMSGLYNDEDSPFLWGGGDFRRAIYTIMRYKGNETATVSEEELAEKMANFVVTHGGRAILNDVIVRGYVYAEGGIMKSVKSPNGNFAIDEEGDAHLRGNIEATSGDIGEFHIGNDEGVYGLGPIIYYGVSSFGRWATDDNQDIAIMGSSSFRVGYSYLGGTYGRAAMGANCDPSTSTTDLGATILYAGYNQGLLGSPYRPVAKIESKSDNGIPTIAARLIGGLQVHGGIMETGQYLTESSEPDIDLSFGSNIVARNGDGSKVMWLFIPTYSKACKQLGVSEGTPFATRLRIVCALNVNGGSNKLQIANRSEDGTGTIAAEQAGRIFDYNGNEWPKSSRTMEQGDVMEMLLVYTPETGYYAQMTNFTTG